MMGSQMEMTITSTKESKLFYLNFILRCLLGSLDSLEVQKEFASHEVEQ
jgi:hypothetical protein